MRLVDMQIEQLTINFDQQQQTIKGFVVVDKIPQNWHVCDGASMAPVGYAIIANNESIFSGKRKHAIIKC